MTASPFTRVAPDLVEAASQICTATLHEAAGRIGALPSAIKPLVPGWSIAGPAFTVPSPGGDNLWIHRAIYQAQPGDILVVHCSDAHEYGYWGEIMSTAAKAVKLGGLVIDGCVRDVKLLREVGFPIFARGLCIRGTIKNFDARVEINAPLQFNDVTVNPGDLVVGDEDGVVVLPRDKAAATIAAGIERDIKEADICRRLVAGERTIDIFGF